VRGAAWWGVVVAVVLPGCTALLGIDTPGPSAGADGAPVDAEVDAAGADGGPQGLRFRARQFIVTGTQVSDIEVVDADGDGHLDVLAANLGSRTVVLLRGKGDGTFKSKENLFPMEDGNMAGPIALDVVDFEGDGPLDIVTLSREGIEEFRGDGRTPSMFGASTPLTIVEAATHGALIAQLVGSENPDIITCVEGHLRVQDQFDDGASDLLLGLPQPPGFPSHCTLALGNFGEFTNPTVVVAFGQGYLTRLDRPDQPLTIAVGPDILSTTVADVNLDGHDDVAFAGGEGGNQLVLQDAQTQGKFDAPVTFPGHPGFDDVAIGRVSGGVLPDLLFVDGATDQLFVYRATDATALHWEVAAMLTTGDKPVAVAIGDLDGDGKTDVVTGDDEGGVSLFFQE
jgi:hypothetical protein